MVATTEFMLSLALLLVAAFIGGLAFRRFGYPAALGELIIGSLIGPYALGFIGYTPVLTVFAELGAIILLFYIGLETELDKLVKQVIPSLSVGALGALGPFALSYLGAILFGYLAIEAMFLGAVLAATSIGITVRVLSDIKRLHTSEGLTILGAGIVDDIIAIILVSVILGFTTVGGLNVAGVGLIIVKTMVFWSLVILIGVKYLCKLFDHFPIQVDTLAMLLMALCFLIAFISANIGLSTIVGAFAIGIALSKMKKAEMILRHIHGLYLFFVPIFFISIGMMIDWRLFLTVGLIPGLTFTCIALVSKVISCSGAALLTGFSKINALRIGFGMSPRGEMGLIVASMGLVTGFIGPEVYSVSIIAVTLTTIVSLPVLKFLYD